MLMQKSLNIFIMCCEHAPKAPPQGALPAHTAAASAGATSPVQPRHRGLAAWEAAGGCTDGCPVCALVPIEVALVRER